MIQEGQPADKKRLPPDGDPAFAPLYDTRMFWPVQRARLQTNLRDAVQSTLGFPLGRWLLRRWCHQSIGSQFVERIGLPRHIVEQQLGGELILEVNPRKLMRSTYWRNLPKRQRPSSLAFIWDGDWDLHRGNLYDSSRYRFISDLDRHRDNLRRTERFQKLKARLDTGKPWSSHQQGIMLDSEERILAYLRIYLSFLDDMALRGFDAHRGNDWLGVAITREGRLLKINRGLHRLAMAQRVGIRSVPVIVKAVHRQWWERVTAGTSGSEALKRVVANIPASVPETSPGAFDPIDDLQD